MPGTVVGWRTYVEVPIFFIIFSLTLQGPVYTNFIIYRSCYFNLGYNETECALLGTDTKNNFTLRLEGIVEPYANVVSMLLGLVPGIICAISAPFIGLWSDNFGRKPVMIASITGQTISFGIVVVVILLKNLSVWYMALSVVPVIVTGGFAAGLTAFFSFITDLTDENNRGLRMGVLEIVLSMGALLGTISSSYLFNLCGYAGVLTTSAVLYLFALLYALALIESLPEKKTENRFGSFFNVEQLKIMVTTTFKPRNDHKRLLILLCITIGSLFILGVMSESGCIYLFLRLKFAWSLRDYTIFTSIRDLVSIFGTFVGVYVIHKLLKVDESVVIFMGLMSCLNSSLVQGLATRSADIYFGGILRLLVTCVSPMIRSLISKKAEPDEIGKIFAVLIMCENLLQIIGSPVYTFIYNNTLDERPEFFNFVTAGIYGVAVILTIIVGTVNHGRQTETTLMVEEDDVLIE